MFRLTRKLHSLVLFALAVLALYSWRASCPDGTLPRMVPKNAHSVMYDRDHRSYEYHQDMPLIFIGGIPRSGTTLMRAILDAHPDVRCGEETRVIPRMLGMRAQWMKSDKERTRLNEAGLTSDVLNSAMAAFILEVIAKHGEPAEHLCSKDPFTLKSTLYLSRLFPNSKFILLIRDGRAVVHSIISRKITISGFDLKNFRQCLEKWNAGIETMYVQCLNVGSSRCMAVYYEQLVLHPRDTVTKVVEFLGIDWDEALMHHSDYINVPGGVSLSNVERSTDQVIKPVNMEALTHWAAHVPTEVKMDIQRIAPMLSRLGYDQHAYPPSYGKADEIVARNTDYIKEHKEYWAQKTNQIKNSSFFAANASSSVRSTRLSSNFTKPPR